ncbi:MAG: hypothetical protein JWM99_2726 [Verrucomicrobiales bacterium]|nr:hypothetical protein [Verrucomicrobiales bacterium]
MKPSSFRTDRRTFLSLAAYGLGGMALASLFNDEAFGSTNKIAHGSGIIDPPHCPVRAKRVIHLCMAGGPSHLESFDFKPKLKSMHDQPFPESFTMGQQLAQLQNVTLKARGPFTKFKKYGRSRQEISELFPHIAGIADDICIVRSMHTEQINHDSAQAFMNAGSTIKGRPSMGSWLLYGIGSDSKNLPGFIVMTSAGTSASQPISARQWSAGFLPGKFQGIQFQSRGDAIHYVGSPEGVCQESQEQVIEETRHLNEMLAAKRLDPEIQTRISQYEMAFKMQTAVPELTDMRNEPKRILDLYGVKSPGDGSFASNCLLARRLVESGVRFIQLYHRAWDHHGFIERDMPKAARDVDQASAALVTDLKERGLLDDTLVIWGGEFGRSPMAQGTGRDHHINAFSIWMAGGGIKPGITWGSTDDLGYRFVNDGQEVHVHDLHATMLYLCGIDHKRLTYRYQGRDFSLTDVAGQVVKGIIS